MSRQLRYEWFSMAGWRRVREVLGQSSRGSGAPYWRQLKFESLESRQLLSITVDNLLDEADGSIVDGDISLRDAIALAPSGATISFSPAITSGGPATITLMLGELSIESDLTIDGPGASVLAIDARGNDPTPNHSDGLGSRIFKIDDGTNTVKTVSISGLTLTGGDVKGNGVESDGSRNGGAIFSSENLTVDACAIRGNAADGGGGIWLEQGSVTVAHTSITENHARFGSGGGIRVHGEGQLAVANTTISGNDLVGDYGYGGGGGVFLGKGSYLSLISSTISGNSTSMAEQQGAGLYLGQETTTIVANSTISQNVAAASSDGIHLEVSTSPTILTLDHTIVAANGNQLAADDDIRAAGELSAVSINSKFSLVGNIGVSDINDLGGNLFGTSVSPIDPMLLPLANNGGPTLTHALLPNSPAIDAGDPAAVAGVGGVPQFDQRNQPYGRVFGVRIDIGAFESFFPANLVVDTLTDENDGLYVPGHLSLREAIGLAESGIGSNTITFAPALTDDGPATILLTQGELRITNDLTIFGPGANLLSIDASGNDPTPTANSTDGSRVFKIDDSSSANQTSVAISGLTLTGGDVSGSGGAILNAESLSVLLCTIRSNSAVVGGGVFNSGSLTIDESTVAGNTADSGGGVSSNSASSQLIIQNSTINGNYAKLGAGIFEELGTGRINNSTISGNGPIPGIATFGGGIYCRGGNLTVEGTTITSNTVTAAGRGIYVSQSGAASLENSIVADDTAPPGVSPDVAVDGGSGSSLTARYSLIGDSTGATVTDNGGNLIGTFASPINPLLGPLANNGGPTKTHALLPGSPAIHAGDPAAVAEVGSVPANDQRRVPYGRIVGGRIDMGAIEFQPNPLAGDYNFNGVVDAADYTVWRDTLGATHDLRADGDGNGSVDAADYDFWKSHFSGAFVGSGAAATPVGGVRPLAASVRPNDAVSPYPVPIRVTEPLKVEQQVLPAAAALPVRLTTITAERVHLRGGGSKAVSVFDKLYSLPAANIAVISLVTDRGPLLARPANRTDETDVTLVDFVFESADSEWHLLDTDGALDRSAPRPTFKYLII